MQINAADEKENEKEDIVWATVGHTESISQFNYCNRDYIVCGLPKLLTGDSIALD